MMNLAIVLKQYLWAEKMSHRDFANKMGWSRATVDRFLTGRGLDGKHLASLLRWLLEEAKEVSG